jgi:hypothetical protein
LTRVSKSIESFASSLTIKHQLLGREFFTATAPHTRKEIVKFGEELRAVSSSLVELDKKMNRFEAFARIHFTEFDYAALNGHWSENPVLARFHYSYRLREAIRAGLAQNLSLQKNQLAKLGKK